MQIWKFRNPKRIHQLLHDLAASELAHLKFPEYKNAVDDIHTEAHTEAIVVLIVVLTEVIVEVASTGMINGLVQIGLMCMMTTAQDVLLLPAVDTEEVEKTMAEMNLEVIVRDLALAPDPHTTRTVTVETIAREAQAQDPSKPLRILL